VINQLLETEPYSKVSPHKIKWTSEGTLELQYSFIKNGDCELVRFSVVGVDGLPDYLDYIDNDGLGSNFDRDAGTQGLDITIDTQGFTDIELRTTHQCGEDKVSRVFAKVVKL
jgi:hypothetical protein